MDTPKLPEWLAGEISTGNPTPTDYQLIGEFITATSQLEASLHQLLRRETGIDENLARLFIGEPKMGDLTKLIRDVVSLKSYPDNFIEALHLSLEDATYFNGVRSVVAHKPSVSINGVLCFYNTHTAKPGQARYMYECREEAMRNLLRLIQHTSMMIWIFPFRGFDAEMLRPLLQRRALLRKSELPDPPGRNNQPRTQKQKRQRPASPV